MMTEFSTSKFGHDTQINHTQYIYNHLRGNSKIVVYIRPNFELEHTIDELPHFCAKESFCL